jgi:kynurenine formamidase
MDAPLHMIEGGKTMDQISLETFFGPGIVLDARNVSVPIGSIVFVYTDYAKKYKTPEYYEGYPKISEGFGKEMVKRGVKIVGMDIIGPDEPPYPTHKVLLGSGVLIIENLANLDKLLGIKKFEVVALPMKLRADAAPVRVIAKILD